MSLAELRKAVLSLGLLAASITGAWGQVTTATMLGTIKDASGAILPGAEVTVRNVGTGATRVVASDQAGRYHAPQLSVGSYEVQAEHAGFKSEVRRGIQLTVGREAVVDFLLQVGAVTETVTVTAEAPLLETTTASISSLVDEKTMRDLPLNSRSLEQFVFLMPTAMAFRHYSGTLTIGFTPKISVAGARTDQNVFLLDGTDINDYAGTTPGSSAGLLAGVETIQEYQVLTHNFSAEFGRSTGAVVNMVTRAGSNEFHGSLFEFVRNDLLDARNFFDPGNPPPFRRNQFGAVLGGPIVRDRTFFMGSYEALRQRLGVSNTSFVPDANARQGILPDPRNPGQTQTVTVNPVVRPYLGLYPLANGRNVGGGVAEFLWSFSNKTNQDYWMTRVDHQINSNHSLFGRYTFDDTRVIGPLTFPFFLDELNSRNQYVTLAETGVFSSKAVNSFRIAFNRTAPSNESPSTITVDPSLDFIQGEGPGVISFSGFVGTGGAGSIGALTLIGPSRRTPGHWVRNTYQVLDNFNYTAGNHAIKFGGNFERLQTNNQQPSNRAGAYSFGSLLEFLQGRPDQFQASWGAFSGWRQSLIGFYFQDDYKPMSNLTLNLGIRYEFTTKVKEVVGQVRNLDDRLDPAVQTRDSFWKDNPSLKAVAPRFGMAWQAMPKTVVRLAVGMYHHQLSDRPLIFLAQQFSRPDRGSTTLSSPSFPRVAIQQIPTADLNTVSVQTFQLPTAIHYSLNVQREIASNTNFTIGYVGTRGYNILHFSEGNSAFPVILADGRKFFPAGVRRRNPNFATVNLITTDSTSDYHGLTVSLQRRFAGGLQFQSSYTFSKALDEGSSTSSSDSLNEPQYRQDPDDRKMDRGLAAVDVRHNFVVNFTLDLPLGPGKLLGGNTSRILGKLLGGWQLNGIATIQPGTPFTPILPFDRSRNQDPRHDRPNVKAGVKKVPILGRPEQYFDPTVFELQPAGFFGNAARNLIIGPGLANFDFATVKNTSLSERLNLQLRIEAFNLLNRTNFGLPNGGTFDSNGNILGSSGRITKTSTSSRQLQLALKLTF